MPGQARRHAARRWNDVDVDVAVVLRREGDQLAVRRERRVRLDPVVGREPPDVRAVDPATQRSSA